MEEDIIVVIPVKSLVTAKSRLSPRLAPARRRAFVEELFEHVLTVTGDVVTARNRIVVSADKRIRELSRSVGATVIAEREYEPQRGQNAALEQAREAVRLRNIAGLLVLSADLPLVTRDDLDAMLALGRTDRTVVLAPDRHTVGTNALFLRPAGILPFCFGPDSYNRHRDEAERRALRVCAYPGLGTAFDVDEPEDLDALEALGSSFANMRSRQPAATESQET